MSQERWKRLVWRSALGLALVFALLEIGVRVWPESDPVPRSVSGYRGYPGELFEPHERRAFWYARGFSGQFLGTHHEGVPVSIDEDGFRSIPLQGKGPRIAIVGDSVTFGPGVADGETFPARLAADLDLRVLNGGVNSYGLEQMLDLVRTELLPRGPEKVVLVLNLNDLEPTFLPDYIAQAFTDRGIEHSAPAAPSSGPNRERGALEEILRRSALFDRVWEFLELEEIRQGRAPGPTERYFRRMIERWKGDDFVAFAARFEELVRSCSESNAELLVVMPPYSFQWDLPEGHDQLLPQRRVTELCRRSGTPFHDLRVSMASHPDRESLLLAGDPQHLSTFGHAWLTSEIAGLLP